LKFILGILTVFPTGETGTVGCPIKLAEYEGSVIGVGTEGEGVLPERYEP
jgi:hypothetical protein